MLKSRLTAFSPSRLLLRHHHLHLLIWRLGQRVMWMWYDMYCGNFNMVCLTRTNVNGSVVCRNISCQQFNHADWAIESLNYIHIGQFLIYLPCQHLVPIQEAVWHLSCSATRKVAEVGTVGPLFGVYVLSQCGVYFLIAYWTIKMFVL